MTQKSTTRQVNASVGFALLLCGAVFATLIFVDRWTSIDVSFPRFWYTSRNFHTITCAMCFCGGWWMHQLAKSETSDDADSAATFRSIRIYTKPDCCLCDDAVNVIRNYPIPLPEPEMINIQEDPELAAKYGESIPVVEIDGRVRFSGIISRSLLDRLVNAQHAGNDVTASHNEQA